MISERNYTRRYDRMFDDLRSYVNKLEELGESKLIEGADWNLEIGAITELQWEIKDSPFLVFDKIKGYKSGYRVVSNLFSTFKRSAMVLGLPENLSGIELVSACRDKMNLPYKPLPPVEVDNGPVKENVQTGDDVDLFKFPTPKWHALDGGRYIGTGVIVITKDPDDGTVNLGTYRVQIHDKNTATVYMSPGRDGDRHRKKYWAKGQGCPVAVVCGQDPTLWITSTLPMSYPEYEYAGWYKNKPIEVVKGVTTDLPIPASAEIVLEGEMLPPEVETRIEGPFGEWPGYYGGGARPEPAFRVKSVMHRDNPIIMGAPPGFLYMRALMARHIWRSAHVWNEMEGNVTGIKGVWFIEEAHPAMLVVSIEQRYGGHAKHAALAAAATRGGQYVCRHIIVIDDDLDPSNISEVLWALGTRCDPANTIEVIKDCWGTRLDPMLSPENRERGNFVYSKSLIIACKPFYWKDKFAAAARVSPELMAETKRKWGHLFY
jgi:UbiD family decarboxylase